MKTVIFVEKQMFGSQCFYLVMNIDWVSDCGKLKCVLKEFWQFSDKSRISYILWQTAVMLNDWIYKNGHVEICNA